MKKCKFSCSIALIIGLFIVFVCVIALLYNNGFFVTDHSAIVGVEGLVWNGKNYSTTDGKYTECKTIAKSTDGNWKINEIKEDPSHTYIVARSFLEQRLYVLDDYKVKTTTQNEQTLIMALIGDDNTDAIDKIEILSGEYDVPVQISDKNDFAFLTQYYYSHLYPSEKFHELFLFPENSIMNVWINGAQSVMYLTQDGSIVIQEMCGDNGVEERNYEVYTAEDKYVLTEEKLSDLLKKYESR